MTPEHRRIDVLALRAQRMEDVNRARQVIAEGLRLASLPGDGLPGMLLVRSLRLNRIDLARGAVPIAAHFGEQLRDLRRRAVPIGDVRAAKSDAVFVRDPIEAFAVGLAHASSGARLVEWFWSRLEMPCSHTATADAVIDAIWSHVSGRPDAFRVVPSIVAELLEQGGAERAFSSVPRQLAQRLLTALKLPPNHSAPECLLPLLPVTWRYQVEKVFATSEPPTRNWIAVASLRALHPRLSSAGWGRLLEAVAPQVRLDDSAKKVNDVEAPALGAPRRTSLSGGGVQSAATTASNEAALESNGAAVRSTASTDQRAVVQELRPQVSAPPAGQSAASPQRPHRGVSSLHPEATQFGGLFFVVRVLTRLGFDAFVQAHPVLCDLDLGLRVLSALATRLDIPLNDPIWGPLRVEPGANWDCDEPLPLPPAWEGLWTDANPEPLSFEHASLPGLIDVWCAAVRAWLDRHVRIDLLGLVQRSGAVAWTRTHIDVVFAMDASDIRVRRAALDIDPGWVPWLGRVVQFHYVHGGVLDG